MKNAKIIGSILLLTAVASCQTTPSLTLFQPSIENTATNQSVTNSQYKWEARYVNNPKVRVVVPIGTPKEVTPTNFAAFMKFLSHGGRAFVLVSQSGKFEGDVEDSGLITGFDWEKKRFLINQFGQGVILDDFQINYGTLTRQDLYRLTQQ
jgi:heme/copper-type cytochrome/quinol oxidase subunit 2